MKAVLQKVPLLADLGDEDLERLASMVRRVEVEAGAELFAEGSMGQEAYVIEAGQLDIIKQSGGRPLLLAVRKPGEVIGEMSLLEDTPRMASARARCKVRVLAIDKESLEHLFKVSPSAARTLLYGVLARYKATGAMLRQGERMAQLGTLTAGVAHELNNPAAAVRRGASHLLEALAAFGAAERALGRLGLDESPIIGRLAEDAKAHAVSPVALGALERSDRQSDIEDWLDDAGVPDPYELSGSLVDLGQTRDTLATLATGIGSDKIASVANWLARTHEVHSLLAEITQGATRVSEIVKALKTYSFLDQAPVQEVDVHEGIDSTLLILRSKLKQNIEVRREFADDLPRIQAYGSELNQVWTNLIDNAADALGDKGGTITIRTRRSGEFVDVEIEDDGPGIPEEIQSKIFDSFFTTKPPGKGTGLGLDISYNIVVNRHRGDLKVVSRPGMTRFCVSIPLDLDKEEEAPKTLGGTELATDEQLLAIIDRSKTVAVVGLRDRPGHPAHDVPAYVQQRGFHILPVNPTIEEALGEKAYPDLKSLPLVPDIVLVFRNAEHVPAIVDEAISVGAGAVWMQEGIVHHAAAAIARDAGLDVVMDTCLRSTLRRLKPRAKTEPSG